VAVIAYLGADHRSVSAHGNFLIHKSHSGPDRGNAAKLEALASALSAEDARVETILRDRTKFPEEKWSQHAMQDVYITAQEAIEFGIADEMREFDIPPEAKCSTSDHCRMSIGISCHIGSSLPQSN
jgi:ATP-dependent protease ClpP protease subunit